MILTYYIKESKKPYFNIFFNVFFMILTYYIKESKKTLF
jgi:hypothetical protein